MKLLVVRAALYPAPAAAVSIFWLVSLLVSLPTLCHGSSARGRGVRSATADTATDRGRGLQQLPPGGYYNRTRPRPPSLGPPPPPPTDLQGRIALINAITDTKIADLYNYVTIDLSSVDPSLTRPAFNINATFYGDTSNPNNTIKFVQFGYNTTFNQHIETTAPYAFCGNKRNDFFECPLLARYGQHRVSVIPWGRNNVPLGPVLEVTFTIVPRITMAPTPTPYPTRAPNKDEPSQAKLKSMINTTSLTVDITNQSAVVEFLVVIEDYAPTRLVSNGYMKLQYFNGGSISSVSFAVQQATNDRFLNFTLRLPIPCFLPSGTYPLYLQIYDGNIDWLYYTTDILKSLMFPFEVNVVNAMIDVTPPKLLNFTALSPLTAINVTNGPATAKFRCTVSDDVSGFKSLTLGAYSVFGGFVSEYVNPQQNNSNTGVQSPTSFDLSIPFEFNLPTAAYQLRVEIYDNFNNVIEYDTATLANMGFPSSLDVVNANVRDYTAPYLISVKALSATTVDVSTAPRTVDIQVTVQDDISGFQYGEVWLLDPTTNINISSTAFAPASARAGVPLSFNVTVRIPRYVPAQAYIFQFYLRDALTSAAFPADDVDGLTYFPIQVINSIVDVTPPELLNFTVSPRMVDPVSGKSNVTFTIVARDDLSGIRRDQRCFLTIESVGESFFQSTLFFPPLDAPAALGTQIIALTATFDETFDWSSSNEIYSLDLRFADAALNSVRFTSRALVQRGFPGVLPTYA